jgi:polyphosphate kinase
VRREGDVIRRYLHLASGNYNPTTARLYTDIGMFTCDPGIGEDATALFNYLTGYSAQHQFQKLLVAPVNLRQRLAELIEREIEHERNGRSGMLIFKMNGLDDPGMVRRLYEASREGVQVKLLVRGICSLRPGVPGLSDNIQVTSIVGRFLEHSRIYYFRNGGSEEIYLGSADLMPRNLNRRVEVLFPVGSTRLVSRVRDEILNPYLADNGAARHMCSDGAYTPKPAQNGFDCQSWFLSQHGPRLVKSGPVFGQKEGGIERNMRPTAVTPITAPSVPPSESKPALGAKLGDLTAVRQRLEDLRSITQAVEEEVNSWNRPEPPGDQIGEALQQGLDTIVKPEKN